ncbi:tail assembly protein [Streptococcus phage Javan284]|uniref:Phage minor structural protein n=2 Tax=Streptococcus lutetiensis TaxID=150055 RepID=A0AB33AMY4_9STRE|nr:phage minor structural protein [Streptococcus lutetiensis 033]QBX25961.1 tail assembly protein [Streptococcus phage Javan284]
MNLTEKAIERTKVTFWHGLSATKHPLGVYDCGSRDHAFANEFDVVSGKKYTVRIIAQRTKGAINLKGGIWYTERTSGYQFDGLAALTQVGELSEDGLGIWERTLTVPNGKIKGRAYVQLEQSSASGFSTAYRVYDAQVFDENEQPLVTDQNNFGALTSPMAAPGGTYIWKRTITYYTDGTNDTVWEYSGVGEKGNTGANGQTSHVHFAFADNATGGGFSLTTPKAYMGWYADFNEAASNDPTKYRWSKWKGDQGLPGKPGADGKTSYFHMAYAESADGRTGFSFKESGQQYQGYYTDFTQSSSTDPKKYTWMDRRAGVEVGSKNLLRKTAINAENLKLFGKSDTTVSVVEKDGHQVYKLVVSGSSNAGAYFNGNSDYYNLVKDRNYTFSFWVLTNKDKTYSSGSLGHIQAVNNNSDKVGNDNLHQHTEPVYSTNNIKANTWTKVWCTFKATSNSYFKPFFWYLRADDEIYIYDMMLNEGTIPLSHSLAPEDAQEQIDSKADQTLTQEQLNALSEKNRNMEAEMAAKASLAEVERWKQAYDEYVAQNDADKTSAEQKLITLTSRVAEWVKDWEDKKVQWSFLDTNMDFGEEGLRLGKKGSPTSILISNDRIGFYSGGSEVASMSNGTLTIDNGIFAKSLQIGHYREEVYEGDKTINVIRWID